MPETIKSCAKLSASARTDCDFPGLSHALDGKSRLSPIIHRLFVACRKVQYPLLACREFPVNLTIVVEIGETIQLHVTSCAPSTTSRFARRGRPASIGPRVASRRRLSLLFETSKVLLARSARAFAALVATLSRIASARACQRRASSSRLMRRDSAEYDSAVSARSRFSSGVLRSWIAIDRRYRASASVYFACAM